MTTTFELMDTDSANVVGFYQTQDEALDTVRESYERHGLTGVVDLALSEKSGEGTAVLVAEGEELARLATGTAVGASLGLG